MVYFFFYLKYVTVSFTFHRDYQVGRNISTETDSVNRVVYY